MSDTDKTGMKITITADGPYIVTGSVPLRETKIVPRIRGNEYQKHREFPLQERYALCRCGRTKTPPYCDGSHEKARFNGQETASRDVYADRAELLEGPDLDMLDDDRCAYTRFCHRNGRSAWALTRNSDDPKAREDAIRAASDCPTGRLVALDKDGNPFEPAFEPAIEILQDSAQDVSGPYYVKGGIPIESADGHPYEPRNRVALCRCGKSCNKPFCDASHIAIGFQDHMEE
ncbi:MAG: CDGSH iron-sulfur domain-containing protein [Saccharofermentanales bacterium]